VGDFVGFWVGAFGLRKHLVCVFSRINVMDNIIVLPLLDSWWAIQSVSGLVPSVHVNQLLVCVLSGIIMMISSSYLCWILGGRFCRFLGR
jgi:hypothetical protein